MDAVQNWRVTNRVYAPGWTNFRKISTEKNIKLTQDMLP